MSKKTEIEMVQVNTWVLHLPDLHTDEPVFYYNPRTDSFQREFSNQCAFLIEEECKRKEKELNLDGVSIAKGITEVPKQALVDTFVETIYETDLAGKK